MKKTLAILMALVMVLGVASIASAEETVIPCTMFLDGYVGIYAEEESYLNYVEDEFYKASGIKFDFTVLGSSHEDSYTLISTKTAGGELDFAKSASPSYIQQMAVDGYLLPLDDLLAEYGTHMTAAVKKIGWDYGRVFGDDTYLIPYIGDYSMYVCTWVRWDLFEDSGYTEYPTTVSKLVEMMYKVMADHPDLNLVGVTSRYPNWPWQHSFCCWYPYKANDYSYISCDENGEPIPFIYGANLPMFFEDETYINFIGQLAQWYKDGIIHNEIWTMDQDQLNTLLAQGRVFVMTEGWSAGQSIADQYAGVDPRYPLPEGAKPQDWRLLATVENDYCGEGAPMVWGSGLEGIVTAYGGLIDGTKCAAEMIQFFDWCYTGEDVYRIIAWGIEGTHWYWDEETGLKKSVLDEAGNAVCSGTMSTHVGNYYQPYSLANSTFYYGNEWKQVFGTKGVDWTAFYQDYSGIAFTPSDTLSLTEMQNYAGEMVQAMFSGQISVEDGIAQLKDGLNTMGWEAYWTEYTEQYKAGMANKWGMEDYYNHP